MLVSLSFVAVTLVTPLVPPIFVDIHVRVEYRSRLPTSARGGGRCRRGLCRSRCEEKATEEFIARASPGLTPTSRLRRAKWILSRGESKVSGELASRRGVCNSALVVTLLESRGVSVCGALAAEKTVLRNRCARSRRGSIITRVGERESVVKLVEPQQFAHAKSVKRPARGVVGDAAAYPLSAGLGDGMDVSCCVCDGREEEMSGFETRKLSLLWVRLLFWLLRTSSTSCRDLAMNSICARVRVNKS